MTEIPDLSGLFRGKGAASDPLTLAQIRAQSRVTRGNPLTPRERFEAFSRLGYHPHGLYRPDEPALSAPIQTALIEIGDLPVRDERIQKYLRLQDHGADLEARGIPGHWDGMQAVTRSTAKYRVVAQSRRVGKTFHAAREGMAVAMMRPRSHIWCAGPNWDAVGRVFDEVVRLVADRHMPTKRLRDQTDEKVLILEEYESLFEGVSLHELPSIVGVSLTFAIVDEAAFVDKIMWDRGVQPPLTDQDGQALLLSNYFGDENWFTQLSETAAADTTHRIWSIHKGETWTNFYAFPQGRNTPSLKIVEETTDPLEFMEQYGGQPVSHVRRIYREYRDRVHVVPTVGFDPHHAVTLAVDPSAGAAPYAVSAIQDYGARTNIIDEFYQDGVISDDVIPVVQARPWVGNVTLTILDSAAPDEAERWRRAGFTNAYGVQDKPHPVDRIPIIKRLLRDPALFRPLYVDRAIRILRAQGDPRHPDELKDREEIRLIYAVEESFADPYLTEEDVHHLRECSHLFIAEHCHWHRYEFKRYAFVEPRIGTNRPERPRKSYDHLMDACLTTGTLIATRDGPIPIEDVVVGEWVHTRKGLRQVSWSGMTNPAADVVRVHLSNGGELVGTADHQVWAGGNWRTGGGWVIMGNLQIGDALWPAPRSLSGTAPATTAIRTPPTRPIECTSSPARALSYTETSGRRRTDRFPRGITSTISMVTGPIIAWITSGACMARTTFESMFSTLRSTSTAAVGVNGSTAPPDVLVPVSVPPPVGPLSAGPVAWMMKIGSASDVRSPSASGSTSDNPTAPSPVLYVTAVEPLREHLPVYDLTVDDAHEFFAGGVLVHNCGYWAWDQKRFAPELLPRMAKPYGGGESKGDFRVLPGLPQMEIDLLGQPIDEHARARLALARIRQETTVRKKGAYRYVTRKS